jgi:hypothetical protein
MFWVLGSGSGGSEGGDWKRTGAEKQRKRAEGESWNESEPKVSKVDKVQRRVSRHGPLTLAHV